LIQGYFDDGKFIYGRYSFRTVTHMSWNYTSYKVVRKSKQRFLADAAFNHCVPRDFFESFARLFLPEFWVRKNGKDFIAASVAAPSVMSTNEVRELLGSLKPRYPFATDTFIDDWLTLDDTRKARAQAGTFPISEIDAVFEAFRSACIVFDGVNNTLIKAAK
jgi:hypothetical protein